MKIRFNSEGHIEEGKSAVECFEGVRPCQARCRGHGQTALVTLEPLVASVVDVAAALRRDFELLRRLDFELMRLIELLPRLFELRRLFEDLSVAMALSAPPLPPTAVGATGGARQDCKQHDACL